MPVIEIKTKSGTHRVRLNRIPTEEEVARIAAAIEAGRKSSAAQPAPAPKPPQPPKPAPKPAPKPPQPSRTAAARGSAAGKTTATAKKLPPEVFLRGLGPIYTSRPQQPTRETVFPEMRALTELDKRTSRPVSRVYEEEVRREGLFPKPAPKVVREPGPLQKALAFYMDLSPRVLTGMYAGAGKLLGFGRSEFEKEPSTTERLKRTVSALVSNIREPDPKTREEAAYAWESLLGPTAGRLWWGYGADPLTYVGVGEPLKRGVAAAKAGGLKALSPGSLLAKGEAKAAKALMPGPDLAGLLPSPPPKPQPIPGTNKVRVPVVGSQAGDFEVPVTKLPKKPTPKYEPASTTQEPAAQAKTKKASSRASSVVRIPVSSEETAAEPVKVSKVLKSPSGDPVPYKPEPTPRQAKVRAKRSKSAPAGEVAPVGQAEEPTQVVTLEEPLADLPPGTVIRPGKAEPPAGAEKIDVPTVVHRESPGGKRKVVATPFNYKKQRGTVSLETLRIGTELGITGVGLHNVAKWLQEDELDWADARLWTGIGLVLAPWAIRYRNAIPRVFRAAMYTANVMDPVEYVTSRMRDLTVSIPTEGNFFMRLVRASVPKEVDSGKLRMSYGDMKDMAVNALSEAVTWERQYRADAEPLFYEAIQPLRVGGVDLAPLDPIKLARAEKVFGRLYESGGLGAFADQPKWLQELAEGWEQYINHQREVNNALGVMVKTSKGWITFDEAVKMVTQGGKKGYFPLGLNQRYMRALRAGGGKDYEELRRAVPGLVRDYERLRSVQAKAHFLNQLDTPMYGHFELARRYNIPYHMREMNPIAWLQRFQGQGAKRQGIIHVFGQADLVQDYYAPVLRTMRANGEVLEAEALERMIYDTEGVLQNWNFLMAPPGVGSFITGVEDVVRMGIFSGSAVGNIAGFALVGGTYGVRNAVSAFLNLFKKGDREALYQFGALSKNAMMHFSEAAQGPLRGVQAETQKVTGMYGINQLITATGSEAAAIYAEQLINALRSNKGWHWMGMRLNQNIARRQLRRLFQLPEAMIDELEAGKGKYNIKQDEELFRRVVQRAGPAINAVFESPMDAPPWFRHNSFLRMVLMATSYMRAASKSARAAVIEATNGNFRPITNILLGTGAAVTAQRWVRDKLAGTAQLTGLSLENVAEITMDYLLEAGWLGFFGWAAKNAGWASSPDSAMMASLTPPVARVSALVLNDLWMGNVGAPEDTGILWGGQEALERLAPLYKWASNWHDADKLKTARWARSAYHAWARRKGYETRPISVWPGADSHAARYLMDYVYSKDEDKNWPEGLHPILERWIELRREEGLEKGMTTEEIIATMKGQLMGIRPVPKTREMEFLRDLPLEQRRKVYEVLQHHDLAVDAIMP